MDFLKALGFFLGGGLICSVVVFLFFRIKSRLEFQKTRSELENEIAILRERLAQEKANAEEKVKLLKDAQDELSHRFRSLSSEALKSNNESFLQLAKESLQGFQKEAKGDLDQRQQAIDHLIKPIQESLTKVGTRIGDLEKMRVGAYESLTQQVKSLFDSQQNLEKETSKLVRALRAPSVRGRWGEIQLKRVVEMAGMLDHCDFFEQESAQTDTGRIRPDLLIRLPGSKSIVVDSKVALSAYLEAVEETDEVARKQKLVDHARQVRTHMQQLSQKKYWEQFEPAPEFVVLFLPGEMFFSAALQEDPGLIEAGVDQRVIIATPTTLIALLRAVAYGWRQEALTKNAEEISRLGKDLYKRIADMAGHMGKVGKNLSQAVESYNRTVGSMESRVMVTARRFQELGSAPERVELDEVPLVETSTRPLTVEPSPDASS